MKKPFLIIIALLGVVYGCKKNDVQPVTLLGKWYMYSEYAGDGWDATVQEGYSKNDFDIFNANNTVTRSRMLGNSDGSTQIINSTLNYIFIQKDTQPSQVIIYNTDRKNYYDIVKLTKDSLHLEMRDTTYNQGVMYKRYYFLKLSRK
jgi:hypothetical protein